MNFLKESGASDEIERTFLQYLKNVDEKGAEYVSSAIVVRIKYEHAKFTEEFRTTAVKTELYMPTNILSFPESLLQFLILNPRYYEHVVRTVILKVVNAELKNMSRPFVIQIEQIHFVYRFEGLPLMDKYKFYPTIQKSLSNFECIVAGRGELLMYT